MIETIKSVPKNIKKKKSNCLKTHLTRFPGAWSSSLHSYWKATAIGACGSLSIEADGKSLCCSVTGSALGQCHFVVDRRLLWPVHSLNKIVSFPLLHSVLQGQTCLLLQVSLDFLLLHPVPYDEKDIYFFGISSMKSVSLHRTVQLQFLWH